MKLRSHIAALITSVSLLYIILFVYAALSKLLDYKNFAVQIGQSPMLSVFAGTLSWLVPLLELVIASLLLFPRLRLAGLFGGYTLMLMFTAYIYILLHYSSYTPCSCGGILEKMSWNQHLVFNMVFVIIAGLAIGMAPYAKSKSFTP